MFKLIDIIIIIADIVACLLSQLLAIYIRFSGFEEITIFDKYYLVSASIFTLVVLITTYLCELYLAETIYKPIETGARISVSIMIAFFILSAIFYAIPSLAMGRGVLSISLMIFGILQFIIHRIFNLIQNSEVLSQKIMILGVGPLAEVIERTISLSPRNLAFAGFIRPYEGMSSVPEASIVGTFDHIEEILSREKVNKLIVSMTERRGCMPVKPLLTCKLRGIEILDSPTFYEEATGKLLIESIQPSWFIYSSGFRHTRARQIWKRIMDIITSLFFIILLLPLIPLIALLVKLSSPGPVLFKQKRVGVEDLEFTLIKFRTMRQDAERDTGAVWATEDDPRITRLGHWMRKMRLDEIPQLYNVLIGDMSFIGPRPERREFVEMLTEKIPYYGERHFIKPGLTGWAQVRYPYGASEEDALEKLRYDLYYIKNYSVILDIIILIETAKVVFLRRGGR